MNDTAAAGARRRLGLLAALTATVLVLAPLAWFWAQSRVPATYSVTELGYMDTGLPASASDGGQGPRDATPSGHGHEAESRTTLSVADLVADPDRPADVEVDLVARAERFTLASGREIDGYTLNGESPGPLIEATVGELVEVHLRNASVPDGVTLHWHGLDVPNAEDGVAGVTQDAVPVGGEHTYRFVADQAGTFWYHSHQVSHTQVVRGLLGPLVVRERHPDPDVLDVPVVAHTYAGHLTLDGAEGDVPVDAAPGRQVRVRLIGTDSSLVRAWASVPLRLVAADGTDVSGPTPVSDRYVTITAGGRVDLELTVPDDGTRARVQVGPSAALVVGPPGAVAPDSPEPEDELDRLTYGTPTDVGFDAAHPDRSFEYSIGRRPGFLDGVPGLWWSVNGHVYPDMPMFVVAEGDVATIRIENHSGDSHPMHLHGHHAVVLARDGVPATGASWWFDSLEVSDGETYDVAFLADNPGIWMDHCHNLEHAAEGLVTHLMYEGVTEPYRVGGDAGNAPE